MKIIERIYEYIGSNSLKISEFERMCGLSNGYLAKMLARSASVGEDVILKILENCPEISIEWLILGRGDMVKNGQNIGNIENSSVVGANVNGSGININSNQTELIDVIKKQQLHIDKLTDIISKFSNNEKV